MYSLDYLTVVDHSTPAPRRETSSRSSSRPFYSRASAWKSPKEQQ